MICRSSRFAVLLGALLALAACDSAEERVAQHFERGLELVEEGAPEKAALEFRNALEVDENFIPARFELAKILLAEGNAQEIRGNPAVIAAYLGAHAGQEAGHAHR